MPRVSTGFGFLILLTFHAFFPPSWPNKDYTVNKEHEMMHVFCRRKTPMLGHHVDRVRVIVISLLVQNVKRCC